MHAVVVDVRLIDEEQARKALHERVIPMVSASPGFVSGVWLDAEDGRGHSIAVFDSEDAARAIVEQMRAAPVNPAVEVESAQVRAVTATA